MQEVIGEVVVMWGNSFIGFGCYYYCYDSGYEGFFFFIGFLFCKWQFFIYIMLGFSWYESLMEKLGKYKIGKFCLYVKCFLDIDFLVFRVLILELVAYMKVWYLDWEQFFGLVDFIVVFQFFVIFFYFCEEFIFVYLC